MNKGQLIDAVQKALGAEATKACATKAVAAVLDGIAAGIKKDGTVQLIGFGTFKTVKRAARDGKNPLTGAKIRIPASTSVKFKASTTVKASVNKGKKK
ncbi:MAG: HU family DNA-binding protein [Opitutales bacterium]|nr:HU family DNA-binding protein [Opitutales bacterium]